MHPSFNHRGPSFSGRRFISDGVFKHSAAERHVSAVTYSLLIKMFEDPSRRLFMSQNHEFTHHFVISNTKIDLLIYLFTYLFICLFYINFLFIYSLIYLFTHLLIYQLTYLLS